MEEDKHEHTYPVNVQLLSNGDKPPILAFECGICHEPMKYYTFVDWKNDKPVGDFLRLRCKNEHVTNVELQTSRTT